MAAIVPVAAYQTDEEDHTQTTRLPNEDTHFDYSQRAQWLRAALLGANDGLVSIASLMMGVGAVKSDVKTMLIAGFAGFIAGACSMAIGEFVSVCSQNEVEIAQVKRYTSMSVSVNESENNEKDMEMQMDKKNKLANPFQAAFASAFSFSIGAVIPLLAAAFIIDYKIRLLVVMAVASFTLDWWELWWEGLM